MNIILLAAGKQNLNNVVFGGYQSYGMYPIRGRPFIWWIINSLNVQSEDRLIIVVNKENHVLINFLNHVNLKYPNLDIVEYKPKKNDNILTSIKMGLQECDLHQKTKIVLGDTMVLNQDNIEFDTILTSKEFKSSNRWCLIEKNQHNVITGYFDKLDNIDISNKEALVGIYCFKDTKLLQESNEKAIAEKKKEISHTIINYSRKRQIKSITTDKWFDFGSISSIVKAGHNFFSTRHFNNISITQNGTLLKSTKNIEKLKNEKNWYQSLPQNLQILAPRIISSKEENDEFILELELYGYHSLSEMFVYNERPIEDWTYIIDKLLSTYQLFKKYTIPSNKVDLVEIYHTKTQNRIAALLRIKEFEAILKQPQITINNVLLKNYPEIEEELFLAVEKLINNNNCFSITHGDLCFSNILFDQMNYNFKFIDPRGGFSKQSIYGDSRYDIAKLRHSIVGLYDFIISGEYFLKQLDADNFSFEIFANIEKKNLSKYFDKAVENYGFDISEIKLIEGLLFLTMIPLHSEDLDRQKAFYLIAIQKINNALYGK